MRRVIAALIFWLVALAGQAPAQDAASPQPVTDPTAISTQYAAVLQRPEYQQQPVPDFFSQLGHWVARILQSLQDSFTRYEYSSQLVRLSYALMWTILVISAASLLYWIVKLIRVRHSFNETTLEKPVGKAYFAPPESFEPEIRQAVGSEQWSSALALSWRRFLSLLERQELVAADRTRTNWEYMAQLREHAVPASTGELCRQLALAYDRHIYGGQPVDQNDWTEWNNALQAATSLLKLQPTIAKP